LKPFTVITVFNLMQYGKLDCVFQQTVNLSHNV
ncbi:MAG: hypothetical protein ACI8YO_002477, partial [Gammaproteobacteria bacterium]